MALSWHRRFQLIRCKSLEQVIFRLFHEARSMFELKRLEQTHVLIRKQLAKRDIKKICFLEVPGTFKNFAQVRLIHRFLTEADEKCS